MPYRRLPNTDTARIRAMKIAMQKGQDLPPHKLAFSSKTVVRLQKLLPHFENNIQFYRHSVNVQTTKSKDYNEILRKARIYLTPFLRVMNMAIYRGDLSSETRTYYGMAANESTVPSLNSENELVSWGKRIIEGEEFRIRKGGNPITNPTIAVVKVRYENFVQALFLHNNQAKKNFEFLEKNAALRREADEIILQMWNEEYGLVYFYRKNEPEKIKTEDIEDKVTSLSNNF